MPRVGDKQTLDLSGVGGVGSDFCLLRNFVKAPNRPRHFGSLNRKAAEAKLDKVFTFDEVGDHAIFVVRYDKAAKSFDKTNLGVFTVT